MSGPWAEQLSGLPLHIAQHMLLTLCALGLGLAISIPLGILSVRQRWLQGPLLGFASIIQTIPGLALLALMVPLLGRIGFVPALIALTLYSLLPVLRNTVTGLSGISPELIEAGQGVGLTDAQIMQKIRLPLAMPVIIAGIRTAAVWTVGMATLATPVGATSLGNYIFSGLQTQNTYAVLTGCFAAALLALLLDGLIRLAEVAAERRSTSLNALALSGLAVMLALCLLPLYLQQQKLAESPRIVIAAKPFSEQLILAELMAGRLRDAGFSVEIRPGMGSDLAFKGLSMDQIDCYVDYSGTIWANYMQREDQPDAEAMNAEIAEWLELEHKSALLGTLGFENAYALAMRRAQAENLEVRSIGDLAKHDDRLRVAGDYELFDRPEWKRLTDIYRLQFGEQKVVDPSLFFTALNEGEVDIIPSYSTDGRIAASDLVVLEDPLGAFPPYDAMILLSPGNVENAALISALSPLLGSIDNEAMTFCNKLVDVDGQSASEAAKELSSLVAEASGGG